MLLEEEKTEVNEQQLHMINPYSNELRLKQRSSSTFLSNGCEMRQRARERTKNVEADCM